MTNRSHMVLAGILAIGGLYLLRMSAVEIQPWDEGLYAMRGESIVRYGHPLDQTEHSIGGLYSSTPPPMVPWGVAAGITIFGHTSMGVRLFAICCSLLAIYMVWLIGRKFLSYQGTLLAMFVLGSTMSWAVYSRQAMTEVPLMAFMLTCLWAMSEGKWWLIGLSFGAALLTKNTVSFAPLLFAIPFLFNKKTRMQTIVGVVLGLVIAAPWYTTMIINHGREFTDALFLPHLSGSVEANAGRIGVLYYVNKLITGQPLLVIGLVVPFTAMVRRSLLPDKKNVLGWIILVWFLVFLVVLSAAPTKNPHYVVMLVPLAVLSAVYGLERLMHVGSRRTISLCYAVVLACCVWMFLPSMRDSLRSGIADPTTIVLLAALALTASLPIILPKRAVDFIAITGYRPVTIGVTALAALQVVLMIWKGQPESIQGGRDVAIVLTESGSKSFAYLYHEHNDGDKYNPQLAWYTNGWMNGWQTGFTHVQAPLPKDHADVSTLAALSMARQPYVVYYHPGASETDVNLVMASLATDYNVELDLDHYTLFSLR